jgi:hypothetical protein
LSQIAVEKTTEARTKDFNGILLKAVDGALAESIGESASRVVKLSVEVSVITRNPDDFKAQLERLFSGSDEGPKIIEEKIMIALTSLLKQSSSVIVSIDKWKDTDLRQFVQDCKDQFIHQ